MPSTVNGIGTHYYGKKNLEVRPGVCEFCRRDAKLASYDTQLWFVVLFIPLIPLGKKHILNYCPHCTRHRVLSLKEWEEIKQKNISGAMEAMKANPQDPKLAVKLHGTLVAFGQTGEAEKLGLLLKERFANDAETQVYLGSTMQYLGKHAESIPFYEQALRLNPELAEAKVAIGLDFTRKGRLDEAQKMLAFLEAPGMAEYPGALFALAQGYQNANRHKEAAALFRLLSERFPKLAQDKNFRKAFKKSEAFLGVRESALPARERNWGRLVGWSVALAIIGAIVFGSNFYISQHRTLYLVSGYDKPVTVEIPGHEKRTISNRGAWTMTLPEGTYEATISGAIQQKAGFTIKSTFFARWFDKPVYVLNVGGAALLVHECARYSESPGTGEARYSFYYGEPFVTLPKVDYPFQSFPESIQLPSHSQAVEKTRIDVFRGPASMAFLALAGKGRYDEALPLAEWHLRLHPESTEILPLYLAFSLQAKREKRALAYLSESVKRRPVEIAWHRMYQEARMSAHETPAVIAEYDALLKDDPENSALLYLRGRLCPVNKESVPLYEKAIARDPKNEYAHFALGSTLAGQGNWADARPHLAEAVRLLPDEAQFQEELFKVRLALKEFGELEKETRSSLAKDPLDHQYNVQLGQVLIAQDRNDEVEKLIATYQKNDLAKNKLPDEPALNLLKARLFYSAGKFSELEQLTLKRKSTAAMTARFNALVELGRLPEAVELLKVNDPEHASPFESLALSLAWKNSGNEDQAAAFRKRAIDVLAAGRPDYLTAAEFLKRDQPGSMEELMDVSLPPEQKALFLVAMAQRFPETGPELIKTARNLNVTRDFPFHLINRLCTPVLNASQSTK
jgi:tetratricopeptide (TPR) repeat protein